MLLRDIEDADDAITTADREHLTRIAEVGGEAGTRQIVDAIAWLEEAVTVEDFDFVGSRATSQNQIVRVLLELSRVELHWGRGGQFFVEWDVFRELSRAQVPKLELILLGVLSSQNETIMNINRNIDGRIGRNAIFKKKSIDVLDGLQQRRFFIDIYCSEFQKWRFYRRVAKVGVTKYRILHGSSAGAQRPKPATHLARP